MWKLFILSLLQIYIFQVHGQTGVPGSVPIVLEDMGLSCAGNARWIRVSANPSGMTGQGGASVGINAFYVVFQVDQPAAVRIITAAQDPVAFHGQATQRAQALALGKWAALGYKADPNAPNQSTALCDITLIATSPNPVTLQLISPSAIGTRVINGSGAQNVPAVLASWTIPLPQSGAIIDLNEALSFWLLSHSLYDEVAPFGTIDMLDLVHFIPCF